MPFASGVPMIHFDSPMSCSRSPITRRAFIGGAGAAVTLCAVGAVAKDEKPVVRFGYITDCHYAAHIDRSGDPRRYAEELSKLRAFAEAMNGLGADFVVEGRDFKDLRRTPAETIAYLDAIEAAHATF